MHKVIYLLVALFWTGFIAYTCLIPSTKLPTFEFPFIDKIVHFTFHFGFTMVWFLYFEKQFESSNYYKSLLISFVFSVLFGIIIELSQGLFTATRAQDVTDILANTVGGTVAIVVVIFYKTYLSKKIKSSL